MKIRHGGLFLADLNPNRGTEAGKTRPVLVLQTDLLNEQGHASTWILPCTTQCTGSSLLRVFLPSKIAGNAMDCEIMIDQSRSIDNRRFKKSLGDLPPVLFREVKEKIRLLGEL